MHYYIHTHTQSGIILNSSRSRPSCTTCTNLARPIAALPICAASSSLFAIHHPFPAANTSVPLTPIRSENSASYPPQRKRHLSIVICSILPSSLPFSSPSFFTFSRIRSASLPPRSQPAGCWCTVLTVSAVPLPSPTREKKNENENRNIAESSFRSNQMGAHIILAT
jgi:hypothetical protein